MSGSDTPASELVHIQPSNKAASTEPASLLRSTDRGQSLKSLAPPPALTAADRQQEMGLFEWKHYHHESRDPLNYKFAAIAPKLGALILKTIYSMSGKGNVIESYATAKSYCSYIKPFFRWLQYKNDKLAHVRQTTNGVLAPGIFISYKAYLNDRVKDGSLQSKTSYQYKGAMVRVLHRIWLNDKSLLGRNWAQKDFQHDEFEDDTRQREPYSAAEARRILDTSIEMLSYAVEKGVIDDPHNELVEIAAYTAISLLIGIESECLDALKLGDVRPSLDGKVMKITYKKRRVRTRKDRSRTTDPTEPLSDNPSVTEQIGTFRTAGGLFALMRKRAKALGKEAEDRLWLKRIPAVEFRNYTEILFSRGLRCDEGGELKIDRTKFRVTYKTAKTVRAKGKLSLVSDDNTPDVKARHYLESDRMKPFYEQAIEDAGLEAIAYALTGAKAVNLPDDASPTEIECAAAELEVPAADIQAALIGETDLWLSSCRSFYNSPFDPPGRPCSKSFFMCLGCGNALVTRRNLPRIIRFLSHIVQKRSELPDLDWQAKFGASYRRITREVLPRFPDAITAEARVIAQGIGALIHIPPEMLA